MKTRNWVIGLMGFALVVVLATASFGQDGKGDRGGRGHHGKHGGYHKTKDGQRDGIATKIYRITDADSVQRMKMKPFVDKASKRMESLRASYQKQEQKVMDSLQAQLKPLLKEEQFKKLVEFKTHRQSKSK